MAWIESMEDHLLQVYGRKNAPLAYVIRESKNIPAQIPDAQNGTPHADEYNSIDEQMIALSPHGTATYCQDNTTVWHKIEEANPGTSYANNISPFKMLKDGRGDFKAIIDQHAGNDKYMTNIKKAEKVFQQLKWKGTGNYLLENHCNHHQKNYIKMENTAQKIPYQLPDGGTRVRYLLDSIESSDPQLQSTMAMIRTNDEVDCPKFKF